jgi:hypothetical protein
MVGPPGRAHPLTRRDPGKAAGLNSIVQVKVLPHTRVSLIDVTTHREEPVIAKARVKEEIVRNEADQRTETLHDTVRDTKVEVEDERRGPQRLHPIANQAPCGAQAAAKLVGDRRPVGDRDQARSYVEEVKREIAPEVVWDAIEGTEERRE